MMAALLLAAALAGGVVVAGWIERTWTWPLRLAAGVPIGIALLGLSGFVLASWFGLGAPALVGAGIFAVAPCCTLLVPRLRAAWLPTRRERLAHAWVEMLAFTLAATALLSVFERAMLVSPTGLGTGLEHNYGDLPFHLAIVESFAKGENFPPEHPELAGTRLTYPFIVDFVLAQLQTAGAELHAALRVQNALLALALLVLIHHWVQTFTADRRAALVAPLLLFLSGGLGCALLVTDLEHQPGGLLALLRHLPHDYTIQPGGELRFGNVITTLLMPQRSVLLGLPLVLIVWVLLWRALHSEGTAARRRWLAAGVITGSLPLLHAHSYAVTLSVGVALALLFPAARRHGIAFGLVALVLGVPQALWLGSGSSMEPSRFVGFWIGWDRGDQNPLWFWLRNAGLFLPLLLLALLQRHLLTPAQRRFYVPFGLCFVIPNLLRLSPWIWDNIKFLLHWYTASVALVALLLVRWSRGSVAQRAGSVLALATLVASGALDVWRVGSRQMDFGIFSPDALAFGHAVKTHTPPAARLLTAPVHDSPALMSGRRLLLGYPGHIWSQGLDPGAREYAVKSIYTGTSEAPDLLRQWNVSFVVVGPQEERLYAVDAGFFTRFPLLVRVGPYRLYDVRDDMR
jgi:hypothetical protein